MEAGAIGELRARIQRAEHDIELNSRYRHEMRAEIGDIKTQNGETRVGVGELKEDMAEIKDQMKWVLRGLVGATITFTGLIITILATVLSHG